MASHLSAEQKRREFRLEEARRREFLLEEARRRAPRAIRVITVLLLVNVIFTLLGLGIKIFLLFPSANGKPNDFLTNEDQSLVALDIRRQNPAAIQDAERSVTNAMVALTKKLTQSEFRPLFVRSIDWTESDIVDISGSENKSIDRAISFNGLVNNKLCDSHRSISVPYFKFMRDGIVSHLTSAEASSVSTRKKKKAKIQETDTALVLSSLKNCFLHDTGSFKFLDTNNFQELPHAPSVEKVDDLLVSCIGQMQVASASDLLWKPLNHEVLMQTRSEKLRSRILGLRSVKQMLDNLKEECLVLLAETIPFLGELLEDVELSVKSLAQEIIKQMEEMSGESLTQHL